MLRHLSLVCVLACCAAEGLLVRLPAEKLSTIACTLRITGRDLRPVADSRPAGVREDARVGFSAKGVESRAANGGPDPYGVSPPSGKQWTMTFDDEFTQDRSIDTNKWNGGAGGTDWCNLDFHGKSGGGYMFSEG